MTIPAGVIVAWPSEDILTFGRTGVGGTVSAAQAADQKIVVKFTCGSSGYVTRIMMYLDGNGGGAGTQAIKGMIYSDNAGAPNALLGTSGEKTVAAGAGAAWVSMIFAAPVQVTSGTVYHIGFIKGATTNIIRYYYDAGADTRSYNNDVYADGPSDPFGAPSTAADRNLSVYASILPLGWSRVAALNSKYLKGSAAGVDPGGTGGDINHAHDSNHTHDWGHTHTSQTGAADGSSIATGSAAATYAHPTHNHNAVNIGVPNAGSITFGGNTGGTGSNDPPYFTVIWIESDGSPAGLPNNCVAFWNDDTAPASWNLCDGGAGRPDMRLKFAKGANLGADGGATGGADSHTHTSDHDHDGATNHNHANKTSGTPTTTVASCAGTIPTNEIAGGTHTHTLAFTQASTTIGSSSTNFQNESVVPAYYDIPFIQNNVGAADTPQYIICVWLGLIADIPVGWVLCDGGGTTPDLRGKYIRCPNTLAGVGATGGSNTHDHDTAAHNHSESNHAHAIASVSVYVWATTHNGSGKTVSASGHGHAGGNTSSDAGTTGDTIAVVQSRNNEPAYYEVVFIRNGIVTTGSLAGTLTTAGALGTIAHIYYVALAGTLTTAGTLMGITRLFWKSLRRLRGLITDSDGTKRGQIIP